MTAIRLKALKMWMAKSYGHTKILYDFELNDCNDLDVIVTENNFEKKFALRIPTREEWLAEDFLSSFDVVVFTDGSKSELGCGAGLTIKDSYTKSSIKLPDECSIFQCEVYAIKKACESVNLIEAVRNKSIAICVDSQAALKSLNSNSIKSATVKDCLSSLNNLGRSNSVELIWVPGHGWFKGGQMH